MNTWSQNAESHKNTLSEDTLEIIQSVRPGKKCCGTMFSTSRSSYQPIYMFQCTWKVLTEQNAIPSPCLIHGKFTKAMESPKLSYDANFKWNFHLECMFLSSLSGREWKKTKKNQFIKQNFPRGRYLDCYYRAP